MVPLGLALACSADGLSTPRFSPDFQQKYSEIPGEFVDLNVCRTTTL
jgi:hypothetical protein